MGKLNTTARFFLKKLDGINFKLEKTLNLKPEKINFWNYNRSSNKQIYQLDQ